MSKIPVLYSNPRCSTCRNAKALLEEKKLAFITKLYLEEPPNKVELAHLADTYVGDLKDLIRNKDLVKKGLEPIEILTKEVFIDLILQYPEYLQRPLLVFEDKTIVGRPIENFTIN